MNAFLSAKQVETEAYRRLTPLLAHWSENGQFVFTDKGPAAKLLQEIIGDIAMNVHGEVHSIELKAEAEASANIFAEEWSNYPPHEDAAPNPGWARKTNATYLWLYFLSSDELWIFRRRAFQEVLYGRRIVSTTGHADTIEGGLIYDPSFGIRQKVQGKRDQKNVTTGFCVPISLITARIAHKHIVVADYLRELETPPLALAGVA
jgi:hypothetical protein